jgi:TRAP-type C4-dicarboxylate transport system permease small subunit
MERWFYQLEKLKAIIAKFDVMFVWLTVFSLGGMTLLITIQVVLRNLFNAPLAWSEELARYLFIWMTFIAGYLGARQNKHIGVAALQNALPPLGGRILRFLSFFICAVFFAIIVVATIQFWPRLMKQTSPAIEMPVAFVYFGMLLGALFMSIWYLLLAISSLSKEGNVPELKPEEVENL